MPRSTVRQFRRSCEARWETSGSCVIRIIGHDSDPQQETAAGVQSISYVVKPQSDTYRRCRSAMGKGKPVVGKKELLDGCRHRRDAAWALHVLSQFSSWSLPRSNTICFAEEAASPTSPSIVAAAPDWVLLEIRNACLLRYIVMNLKLHEHSLAAIKPVAYLVRLRDTCSSAQSPGRRPQSGTKTKRAFSSLLAARSH